MIYTVTELDTGRCVGASAVSWNWALSDAYYSARISAEIHNDFGRHIDQHADGFALHGFKLGVRE